MTVVTLRISKNHHDSYCTTWIFVVVSIVIFVLETTPSPLVHSFVVVPNRQPESVVTRTSITTTTSSSVWNNPHYQQQQQQQQPGYQLLSKVLLKATENSDDNTKEAGVNSKKENKLICRDVECLILGGGISGSTLAHNMYYHNKKNTIHDLLVVDARNYLGGNVKSHSTLDGYVWEEGPNSFATQPSIVRISHELFIADQLVFANEALPPWVYYNKELHPLPKGQGGKGPKGQLELLFGPNGIFQFVFNGQLLSWPGKIRAGIGAFLGHPGPPGIRDETSSSSSTTTTTTTTTTTKKYSDETIQEWVTRILGEEVFLRCIDPFVSGVYAGNPATLTMRAALPKIARIEDISYNITWNKLGALFYGGLLRQIELTKERKMNPPNKEWIEFEYGNPGSYRKGLSTLPNAIAKELGLQNNTSPSPRESLVQLEWKIIKVEKENNNNNNNNNNNSPPTYLATFETPDGIQIVRTKSIVSTLPAHALKGIFTSITPVVDTICDTVRSEINRIGIYYPPVAAVTVAYPKSSFRDMELPNEFGNLQNLPGFGNLNPRTEKVRTLGTLWSSSLFPDRAPKDYNLLLNYIGGSRDINITQLSEEELIKEVDKGCRTVLLKPDAPLPKVLGYKIWPTAIPQYEKGHFTFMEQLNEIEKVIPGLWICGNYRTGVAFPDCVTFGYEQAKIVNTYLQSIKKKSSGETETETTTSTTKEDKNVDEAVVVAVDDDDVKVSSVVAAATPTTTTTIPVVENKEDKEITTTEAAATTTTTDAAVTTSATEKDKKSEEVIVVVDDNVKIDEGDEKVSSVVAATQEAVAVVDNDDVKEDDDDEKVSSVVAATPTPTTPITTTTIPVVENGKDKKEEITAEKTTTTVSS